MLLEFNSLVSTTCVTPQVETQYLETQVEYANDIDTHKYVSGFPVIHINPVSNAVIKYR